MPSLFRRIPWQDGCKFLSIKSRHVVAVPLH
jgi:hypothetical protein